MKWWIFVAMSLCLTARAEDPKAAIAVPVEALPGAKNAAPAADEPNLGEPQEPESVRKNLRTFSSAVNVLRQGERVEAVFRNGDIFLLPRGARQHGIFKALQESERSGSAVSVTVDDRTGVIHSVSGADKAGNKDTKK